MNRLITLVYEKNHYLEKFYACGEAEMTQFLQGHYEGLESFYQNREKILEMIRYVDAQIEKNHEKVRLTDYEKREFRKAMTIKDEYVQRIVDQDLQILSCIERAKSDIIQDLQNLKKGKKAMAGYKMPSFTNRLDEEA